MFDLFRSREKSTRYLLGGLLSLVALSMVVTLIPGFGSGATASNDQIIAEIGKNDVVTMREVQVGLQDTLRNQNVPPELVSMYAPQIVNQIVIERATAHYANEFGYSVTDDDVAQVIRMMVPQLFEGGKFVGKEAYAQFLASNNTTIGEFERQARMRAGLRRLEGMVLEGMIVTPAEVEQEFRERNEKIKVDYVKLEQSKIQSEIKVTPEEVNAHWASSKGQYQIPQKRGFRMVVFDEQKMSEQFKASEEQARRAYDQNKDNFRTPERVKVRHILLKTMEKPKEEHDAIKKRTEDLLKQLKGGADFAELAKKNSEDTVSAQRGGDLDWVVKGQMVPEFEKTAFSLKPNQISDVIQTQFGYHIVQTTAREEARLKTFDEVKDQISKDLTKQQVYDKMQNSVDQVRATLQKSPEQAEALAQQLGASYAKVDKVSGGDPLPLIGAAPEFYDALGMLGAKGEVTEVVQIQNKLIVAVLDEIFPSRQAELNEVETQVRGNIARERAQRLLGERSQQLLDKVRAANGDLRKAASQMNLEVKSTPEFGRDGTAEGIGQATQLQEGFKREVGAVFGPVSFGDSTFVVKVTGKTPADMSKLEEQRFDMLIRLKGRKAQERKDLFEDGLLRHLESKGVVKIHKDTVKRLVDSFKNS